MLFLTAIVFLFSLSQMLLTTAFPMNSSFSVQLKEKRAFYVNRDQHSTYQPWPNSLVEWCLEGGIYNSAFNDLLDRAWEMWVDAIRKAEFAEGSNLTLVSRGVCVKETKQRYLRITLTNKREARTTVGYQLAGTTMSFDMDPSWGYYSAATNLAHELGHAFGLLHEHQKPDAWESSGLYPNGRLKLNCENLKDYDDIKAVYRDMTILCSSRNTAGNAGFSAVEMLPWTEGPSYRYSFDFDWDSIMLYGSFTGSKVVNGQRQKTLVKADGSPIYPKLKPSTTDALAIIEMYPRGRFGGLWLIPN